MRQVALGMVLATALLAATGTGWTADPQAIDWSRIPARSLTLFYPGESTYDWLVGANHKGARSIRQGKACVGCHEDDETDLGNILVKGGRADTRRRQERGEAGEGGRRLRR